MKKFLLLFLLLTCRLCAEPPLFRLTAESEPLVTFADCVNMLTGDFFQTQTDLTTLGAAPLEMARIYDSGHNFLSEYGFGVGLGYPLHLDYYPQSNKCNTFIDQRYGCKIPFDSKKKHKVGITSIKLSGAIYKKGYTNCGRGSLFNTSVHCSGLKKYWSVTLPDGSHRDYRFADLEMFYSQFYHKMKKLRYRNFLEKETLPNGLQHLYEYDDKCCLQRIRVLNRDGSLELGRLDFTIHDGSWHVRSNHGVEADYRLEWVDKAIKSKKGIKFRRGFYLKQANTSLAPEKKYEILTNSYSNLLNVHKILEPDGRFLQIQYSKKQPGHVTSLSNANGTQYTFRYGKKKSSVTDAKGRKTAYFFSKNRLTKREEFDSNNRQFVGQLL